MPEKMRTKVHLRLVLISSYTYLFIQLRDIFTPHNEALFRYLGYRIPEWECGEMAEDVMELPTYPPNK